MIKNEESGILIPNFGVDDFYKALLQLINDVTLRKQLGDNLKNVIHQNYTAAAVCEKYIEFIDA